MKKPSAILFDYGHTLANETAFDSLAGYAALLPYAADNPRGITAEQLAARDSEMFGYLMANVHDLDIELNHQIFFRTLFESLGLRFDIPPVQQELIYYNAACQIISPMPGAAELLDWLWEKGIPTGVVSNISFSGGALRERIRSILPNERFRFVMASSDYGWRKPSRFLFDAAIANIGLPAGEIWFCGDNTQADVMGAAAAGMTPVWVDSPIICPYRDPAHDTAPAVAHIHVTSLGELRGLLCTLG